MARYPKGAKVGPLPQSRWKVWCPCRPDGPWEVIAPVYETFPCVRCGHALYMVPVDERMAAAPT